LHRKERINSNYQTEEPDFITLVKKLSALLSDHSSVKTRYTNHKKMNINA